MRNGEPISQQSLTKGINPGISYDQTFEGWQAAKFGGADLDQLEKWDNWGYPREFMARVIAFHRQSKRVESFTEEAVAKSVSKKK
jgi:hypothetical protein